LCDGYRLFAETFASVLTARGHRVVGICHDPRGLAAAVSAEPVDLCVADFGDEDCHHVRPTRLLALTAEEDAVRLRSMITAGVDGIVSKRRGLDEIMDAMAVVHGGATYYDPVLIRRAVTPEAASGAPGGRRRLTGVLTPRELEVLHQLVHGVSTGGMAAAMGISVTTVRTHTQSVLHKLGVNSRLQAAACAISIGLIEPPTG